MRQANEQPDEADFLGPLVRGKYAVAAMIAIGLVLSGVTAWFYYTLQRRPLELWGRSTALLIMKAPRVEAFELSPHRPGNSPAKAGSPAKAVETVEAMKAAGRTYWVVRRRDVSQAPGFSHIRHGLLNDAAFAWNEPRPDDATDWRYALRFRDAQRSATLLFDAEVRHVANAQSGASASIDPVAAPIRAFFEEQLHLAGQSKEPANP